jgi:hypothetical protein
MPFTVTTLCELNEVVDQFIRKQFDHSMLHGSGKEGIRIEKFKCLEKYIYFVVFETLDIAKINYGTLNIESILIRVRREMTDFVDTVYDLEGNERELGILEENLTGYYIQAYIFSKL